MNPLPFELLFGQLIRGFPSTGRTTLLPETEISNVLFAMSCIQRTKIIDVSSTLEKGLASITTGFEHLWETIPILLAKEETSFCKRPYNTHFDSVETSVKFLFTSLIRMDKFQAACNIEAVHSIVEQGLQKHWFVTRDTMAMKRLLDCCFKAVYSMQVPAENDALFLESRRNVDGEHDEHDSTSWRQNDAEDLVELNHIAVAKMEFVIMLILQSTIIYPNVTSVQTCCLASVKRDVSAWFAQLRNSDKSIGGMREWYESILLAMACLTQLSTKDYEEAQRELQPGTDIFPSGSPLCIIAGATSAMRWLLLHVATTRNRTLQPKKRKDHPLSVYGCQAHQLNRWEKRINGKRWENFGNVYAAKSQLSLHEDVGLGVFASRSFSQGDIITEFCGDVLKLKTKYMSTRNRALTSRVYVDPDDGDYQYCLQGNRGGVVARNTKQMGSLVQDPLASAFYNSENVKIDNGDIHPDIRYTKQEKAGRFFEIATRNIAKGEEIYSNYYYTDEDRIRLHLQPKVVETYGLFPPCM